MLRDSFAIESIYGFASVAQQAEVSPEESVFVLTSSQLREIVFKAAQEALESQKSLHEIIQDQAKETAALNAKLEAMQKDMDSLTENQFIQLRLINDLRKDKEPQPLQKVRAEILRALLVANNGMLLAKQARQKMRVPKSSFSELLKICDFIEIRPYTWTKDKTFWC